MIVTYRWRGRECRTDGRVFVAFDGMSWPLPHDHLGDEGESPSMARSRAAAYEALLGKPASERERIVYAVRRAIREGERMRRSPPSSRSPESAGKEGGGA